ncbi:glycosyltransferase family 2 protein [Cellulomonas sp. P5_E12]
MTRHEACVVVVTYNSADWVERCLRALVEDAKPTITTEVIVIDNGSDSDTQAVLQRWSSRVRVHLAGENLGFGRACNLAVSMTDARCIVLVNPDAVIRPGCIEALVAALADHPEAGLVGGRTVRPDGALDPKSCWGRPTLWSWFCFATGLSTLFRRSRIFDTESLGAWDRSTPREVGIVSGCLLAAERSTWQLLDGFDERYFMYGEDADLSMRASALGFRPRITPDAVAMHAVGASSANRAAKNTLLMTGKATLARTMWPRRRARIGIALLVVGTAVRAFGESVRQSPAPAWRPLLRNRTWTRGWVPAQQGRTIG